MIPQLPDMEQPGAYACFKDCQVEQQHTLTVNVGIIRYADFCALPGFGSVDHFVYGVTTRQPPSVLPMSARSVTSLPIPPGTPAEILTDFANGVMDSGGVPTPRAGLTVDSTIVWAFYR